MMMCMVGTSVHSNDDQVIEEIQTFVSSSGLKMIKTGGYHVLGRVIPLENVGNCVNLVNAPSIMDEIDFIELKVAGQISPVIGVFLFEVNEGTGEQICR